MADDRDTTVEASPDPASIEASVSEAHPTTTSPPPPTRQAPPIPPGSSNPAATSTLPVAQVFQTTQHQKSQASHPAGAPARQYLNEFVTPYLLEGMKALAREQPPNPLQTLGQFLLEKSAQLESGTSEKTNSTSINNHHTIDLPMTTAPEKSFDTTTAEVDGDAKMADAFLA